MGEVSRTCHFVKNSLLQNLLFQGTASHITGTKAWLSDKSTAWGLDHKTGQMGTYTTPESLFSNLEMTAEAGRGFGKERCMAPGLMPAM